jgi:hypothetical protein
MERHVTTFQATQANPGGAIAHAGQILRDWTQATIQALPTLPDEDVLGIAHTAAQIERAGFVVRGACAHEMKTRMRERALRGQDDDSIGAQLSALARDIGVAPSTLDDDSRIFETFQDDFRGDTELLDREHYRLALSAPDPHEAIELARTQKDKGTYSTRDYREDVKELKEGKPAAQVAERCWIHAPISEEANRALHLLCERRNKRPAECLNQIILEAWEWSRK